jgi:endoglucanase Acf2
MKHPFNGTNIMLSHSSFNPTVLSQSNDVAHLSIKKLLSLGQASRMEIWCIFGLEILARHLQNRVLWQSAIGN